MKVADDPNAYWDHVAEAWSASQSDRLWRRHSDTVNCMLIHQWLQQGPVGKLLKTDLFDEAFCAGLYPTLQTRASSVVGIDVSEQVIHEAVRRHPGLTAVRADVRQVPFENEEFDVIFSNSTLDHFGCLDDLVRSIRELARVLRPDGQLILTLDNAANPIISLRNRLPFRALHRFGILPYYVGATCGPRQLKNLVAEAGLQVVGCEAIMHCPRVLAVAASRWIDRYASERGKNIWLRFLRSFEHLGRWPTRYVTGHFIALQATKSSQRPQDRSETR